MSKMRILIIDDNKAIHSDFQKIFQNKEENSEIDRLGQELFGESDNNLDDNHYELESAYQGEEGFNLVQKSLENDTPYQLAFIDMRMPPGWDGLKTIEKISAIDNRIQLVICTAYSDYSYHDISKRIGKTDRLLIIKKPFDQIEVIQLASTLGQKWQLSEIAQKKMEQLELMVEERTKELKKANDNLVIEMTEKEQAQVRLVNASKLATLGEMAAGIAHEINNPLTIINGYSQVLEKMVADNDINADIITNIVPAIKKTIQRISKIIDGLKSFSRDGSGDNKQSISINKIIQETLEFSKGKFQKKNIPIDLQLVEDTDLVYCRETQISQVLLNLLSNSYDAIKDTEKPWIKISCTNLDDRIEIALEDSGKGLSQEIVDKIMNPFFTTKEVGSGTGLGLSISHGIIKDHGGKLYVDQSVPNTCFKFSLEKKVYEKCA